MKSDTARPKSDTAPPCVISGYRQRFFAFFAISVAASVWLSPSAQAVEPTSCDIKTGPSCLWKEGCDCDHDGYVISSGKASKYCHFTKCPIDSDDKDPNKLGMPSTYNADGDGWTKDYDCNDADKCIGKTCGSSTCGTVPVDPDADKDGFGASQDCNDKDANIKPGSPVACCNCVNLNDPAKVKALGCTGCPLSQPAPDAGSTDTTSPDAGSVGPDATKPDASQPDAIKVDGAVDTGADLSTPDSSKVDSASPDSAAGETAGADSAGPDAVSQDTAGSGGTLTDAGIAFEPQGALIVGSGSQDRSPPPAPGCTAAPRGQSPLGWLLLALVVGLAGWSSLHRARRRTAAMLAGLVVLSAASVAGCVRVEPWQRQKLAHRCMVLGRNGGEKDLEQHAFQYREGSAGGFGGGGGGCGCN